jgi:hypothetical protein
MSCGTPPPPVEVGVLESEHDSRMTETVSIETLIRYGLFTMTDLLGRAPISCGILSRKHES